MFEGRGEGAQAQGLREIVWAAPHLMALLREARALALPEGFVAAGAIRNTVWDGLHDKGTPTPFADVDLVYFDPTHLDLERDRALSARLSARPGAPRWEVVNQAAVHTWYRSPSGDPIPPFTSMADALSGWPETATAVGVRLTAEDTLEILAPLGLGDLLDGILRPGPRTDPALFERRLREKGFLERWPGLVVRT